MSEEQCPECGYDWRIEEKKEKKLIEEFLKDLAYITDNYTTSTLRGRQKQMKNKWEDKLK